MIITSNRTREIHDALKRRCLYHWVGYPTAERELQIVRAKVPGISKALSEQVVHFVQALRKQDLFKSPGVAETLDWAGALAELDVVALDPTTVSDTLGVLLKYQDDIARIEGTKAKELLDEVRTQLARGGVRLAMADGRLAENVVYFARALRAAGIPVGPGSVLDALDALRVAGVGTREDFYWTLHAVFVKRHEHTELFDQAFRIFFRRRDYLDKLMASLVSQAPPREEREAAARRAAHRGRAVLRACASSSATPATSRSTRG